MCVKDIDIVGLETHDTYIFFELKNRCWKIKDLYKVMKLLWSIEN